MPKSASTSRGAFGRPHIPTPPGQRGLSRRKGILPKPPDRIMRPARRRVIQLLLLMAGAAAGLAIATTALSLSDSAFSENPAGRPAAPALPDYGATIRAPTPTPGGDPVPSTDVPLGPDDIAEFRLHTFARVAQEASAIVAGTNLETLMRVVAEPPGIAACFEQLAANLDQETLLPPTPPYAEQVAACIIDSLAEQPKEPHPYELAEVQARSNMAATFLHRYAASVDPTTRTAATLPSPLNMAMWRDSRSARGKCYETITPAAKRVAEIDRPSPAGERLGFEAELLRQCLSTAVAGNADDAREP